MKDKTLEYYRQHASAFFERTVNADMSDIYEVFLDELPAKGRILDLGCGSGRDSRYFREQGYEVVAVDGCPELCEMASVYIGQKVICKEFEELDYAEEFDGIWACASLLHVQKNDMAHMIWKLHKALAEEGILYVSFKHGTEEGMRNGRYFKDYVEGELQGFFRENPAWKWCTSWITGDVREGRKQEQWLNIIAKKRKLATEEGKQ